MPVKFSNNVELVVRDAESLAREAMEAFIDDHKLSEEEALDLVAGALDAALPLKTMLDGAGLPPVVGEIAEAKDGDVIRKILQALTDAFRPSVEKLLQRADAATERGAHRRAAALLRRAARVADRQAR